jgi:formyl-CoA transferase/succinyl-CoA--D-citramalate CoA-transferase
VAEARGGRGALGGLRILDLGTWVSGPFGPGLLAEFGAEVIKIEPPRGGDPVRAGTAWPAGPRTHWVVEGRNKKSVTLALDRPEGQAILRRLAAVSDAVVENFRPGTLERWGLGPDVLRGANPRLIVVRVSGFGQTGPWRDRPASDRIALAAGGLLGLIGEPDGPPMRPGVVLGDYLAGLFNAVGLLMALYHRDARGGPGQDVDVAQSESVLRLLENTLGHFGRTGEVRRRSGNVPPAFYPDDAFPTGDGRWVVIVAGADWTFQALAGAMNRPDLPLSPRFDTVARRAEHARALWDEIAAWTRRLTQAEVLEALTEAEVPAGPVLDAAGIAAHPQYRERGMLLQVPAEDGRPALMPGPVPRLSATPGEVRWAGPPLGRHTEEILGGLLGMTAEELQALRRSGII